jgi:hypothetical protein
MEGGIANWFFFFFFLFRKEINMQKHTKSHHKLILFNISIELCAPVEICIVLEVTLQQRLEAQWAEPIGCVAHLSFCFEET